MEEFVQKKVRRAPDTLCPYCSLVWGTNCRSWNTIFDSSKEDCSTRSQNDLILVCHTRCLLLLPDTLVFQLLQCELYVYVWLSNFRTFANFSLRIRALFGKTPSTRTREARPDTLVKVSARSVLSGARGGRSKFFSRWEWIRRSPCFQYERPYLGRTHR